MGFFFRPFRLKKTRLIRRLKVRKVKEKTRVNENGTKTHLAATDAKSQQCTVPVAVVIFILKN